MIELERWFPTLAPPQGGRVRLQAAMAAFDDRTRGFWPGYAWAGLAMLAIALSPLLLPMSPQSPQPDRVAAVMDALAEFGVEHLDLPLTPERVWRAIRGL